MSARPRAAVLALAAAFVAPGSPASAETVTLTVSWPDAAARPVRIGFMTEAGPSSDNVGTDYSDRWVKKVATRLDPATRDRKTDLDLYFGSYSLRTPVRFAPGITEQQVEFDSRPLDCTRPNVDQLEADRRRCVGNPSVALKVAMSAKRTLDSFCSYAPKPVVDTLGTTLAAALCDYASYGDATLDLGSFAATVPDSLAALRSRAESCARNRSGLARLAIDQTRKVLASDHPNLAEAARTVAQVLELARQQDLAPVFAQLQFDPADYRGHLLNLEYRDLAQRAALSNISLEKRQSLQSEFDRLRSIASAEQGSEASRAFAKSELTSTNIADLEQDVIASDSPEPDPDVHDSTDVTREPGHDLDDLVADTARSSDDLIPS